MPLGVGTEAVMRGSVVGSAVSVGSDVSVALRVGDGSTVDVSVALRVGDGSRIAVRLGTGVWVKDLVAVPRRARLVAADVLLAAAVAMSGWIEAREISAASLHPTSNKHIAITIML